MSRRARILTIGGALLLLILSRLPFLLADPSWGVFAMEHIWLLDEPAAVEHMEELTGASGTRLTEFNDNLFGQAYHAGAAWIAECVRAMGRLTGSIGLRELKLVGVSASVLALGVYLWALLTIWPTRPVRWVLPVVLAWLAPPTLLLWSTVMPMGHYLDSWFFHALWLPPLVLVLSDRAGPASLAAFGAAAGVACAYVFSNVLFVVVLGLLYLLFSTRSRFQRAAGALALGVSSTGVWLLLAWDRIWAVGFRLTRADLPRHTEGSPVLHAVVDLLARIGQNTALMFGRETVVDGTSWARRGIFAVLQPTDGALGTGVAYVLLLASVAGSVYLLRSTVLLLHPRRRERLDLPGRFLAAQGLLLGCVLVANVVFLTEEVHHARVNYAAIAYPPLLLGLSMGAAALLQRSSRRARRWAGAPAICLGLVLGVGWAQASAWSLRGLDGPDVPRMDYVMLARLPHGMQPPAPPEAAAGPVEAVCLRAHPQNEAFCAVNAWDAVLGYFGEPEESDAPAEPMCEGLAPADRAACGVGVGMFINDPLVQEGLEPERNLLIYQQCSFADTQAPTQDLFAPCAVGVARALEGLTCSWAGTPLH